MTIPFLFIPLAAVFQSGQQDPVTPAPDRKVRIEIVTTENGETKRVTKEFDANDDAQVQDALRELGVLNHMKLGSGERDLTIDIRGFGEGDDADLFMRMAPLAPAPPLPPGAPMAFVGEPTAYLGVSTRNLSKEDGKEGKLSVSQGAVILEVTEGSPAEKLGLRVDDIITEVDGKAVDGPGHLAELIQTHKPKDEVKLSWLRDGKAMKGSVELGERKGFSYAYSFDGSDLEELKELEKLEGIGEWKSEKRAFLGVTPGEEEDEGPGVTIGSVERGSAAEQMGLKAGDRITAINGSAVADFDALAELVRSMKPGDEVSVDARRDGASLSLKGTLGERKSHFYFKGPEGMEGFKWEGLDPSTRQEIRVEMDQLRKEMDELRREMGKEIRREVRVRVEARKLSDDEKALLRDKGVAVDRELKLDGLQAFPNPSNGFYRIQFDMPERGDLMVDVHNAKGERVYQEKIVGFKGRYERTLDLSDQATGSYFLVITQGEKTATVKLVKE
ncbi:MAG: PDZ domain-containing protein [Flavobacteriales bacterium]|nr:PDZ domain-containing protein [Flavobacteriales bacterium]